MLAACGENDDEEGFEPLGFAQDALSDDEFGLINRDGVTVLDVADFGFGREECVEVPFPYGWVLDLHQSFRARVREDHFKEAAIHGRGAVRGFPNRLKGSQNVIGGDLTQPLLPKEGKGKAADFALVDGDGVFRAIAANVGDFGDGNLAELFERRIQGILIVVGAFALQLRVNPLCQEQLTPRRLFFGGGKGPEGGSAERQFSALSRKHVPEGKVSGRSVTTNDEE